MKKIIALVLVGIMLAAFEFFAISGLVPLAQLFVYAMWFLVFLLSITAIYLSHKLTYNALKSRKKRRLSINENSVAVYLFGRPVYLDLQNLRDESLCMRDEKGNYETESGEQHFSQENGILASGKIGKRVFTNEENEYIASLPRRWDDKNKGMWFNFEKLNGGTVEVFLPAAGLRNSSGGGILYEGNNGYYWSASVTGNYGYYLYFYYYGGIGRSNDNSRSYGFSVRCVRDIE